MVPDFEANGYLGVGIHLATWREIVAKLGTTGHRRNLLEQGTLRVLRHLREAGVQDVWLDGSMATEKDRPSDYDLCYAVWQGDRNKVDPLIRSPLAFTENGRQGMRRKYLGDIFPQSGPTGGFLEFFQQDHGIPKGIIKVDMSSLP